MARLIDANELKQRILEERDKISFEVPAATYELRATKPNHHGNAIRGGIRKALRCMEQCKTVDAVPVVRCKDCKEWLRNRGVVDSPNGHCFYHETHMNGYDFCSYGERGTDD